MRERRDLYLLVFNWKTFAQLFEKIWCALSVWIGSQPFCTEVFKNWDNTKSTLYCISGLQQGDTINWQGKLKHSNQDLVKYEIMYLLMVHFNVYLDFKTVFYFQHKDVWTPIINKTLFCSINLMFSIFWFHSVQLSL